MPFGLALHGPPRLLSPTLQGPFIQDRLRPFFCSSRAQGSAHTKAPAGGWEEHCLWLESLYGRTGSQVVSSKPAVPTTAATAAPATDGREESTASESGKSTIATPTPPPCRRTAAPVERDAAGAPFHGAAYPEVENAHDGPACLPPYDVVESREADEGFPSAGGRVLLGAYC